MIDPGATYDVVATGLAASPGAASGHAVFDADTAEARGREGEDVILVRWETSPDDIHGLIAAKGVLTARHRLARRARRARDGQAVRRRLRRADDRPGAQGRDDRRPRGRRGRPDHRRRRHGERHPRPVELVPAALNDDLETILGWADDVRRLEVHANADTPADATKARELGAQGIGLCRTEHMFFGEERLPVVQEMILADDETARRAALDRLLPFQQSDFEGIFEAMAGLPVTIRLLDPPLHEFLPPLEQATEPRLRDRILRCTRRIHARHARLPPRPAVAGDLRDAGPRDRAGRPGRARAHRRDAHVEIMHPLVAFAEELRRLRELTVRVATEEGFDLPYLVGTMIELPRACMRADEIAGHADFFSFGTNDLTQTALGFSRDDAEGKFLTRYLEDGVLAHDPFATLDQEGVGELMRSGSSVAAQPIRADDRDLRRARRRPGVGALLPRARARLRLLLALPRSRRPAGGGAGGARRERRGPIRGGRRLAMLASALAILLAAATTSQAKLPLRACVVQGVPANCGTLLVPENRDTGWGHGSASGSSSCPRGSDPRAPRVRVPRRRTRRRRERADRRGQQHLERRARAPRHRSRRPARHRRLAPAACPQPERNEDVGVMIRACLASLNGDPTQYGTAAAADDLEAVRAALGYRTLNLYGISYGATLAQVYLARHPRGADRRARRRRRSSTSPSSAGSPSTGSARSTSSPGAAPASRPARARSRAGRSSSAP